jgi:hypothetical protein
MSHSQNTSNLQFVNTLNQTDVDSKDYMTLEAHNPGDRRLYRIVDHKGSRNLSDLMTCHDVELFISGMIAQASKTSSLTIRP